MKARLLQPLALPRAGKDAKSLFSPKMTYMGRLQDALFLAIIDASSVFDYITSVRMRYFSPPASTSPLCHGDVGSCNFGFDRDGNSDSPSGSGSVLYIWCLCLLCVFGVLVQAFGRMAF